MKKTTNNFSSIVKCSYCRRIFSDNEFDSHQCSLPINDVRRITVEYFQDDSVNGEKIMTGKGLDGVLYSFVVTPRTAIPYFAELTNEQTIFDKTFKKNKTDGDLTEPFLIRLNSFLC